ncbi:hypothetical protein B0H13DRAFT_2339693 [Mycena leptocephala]|nr:hypothetical protein B0H13DRAFT_2339693 [Mycena leptocephala]
MFFRSRCWVWPSDRVESSANWTRHKHYEQSPPTRRDRAIVGDAFHDSAEKFPLPRCHPETRTRLLKVLGNWAQGNEYFPPGDDALSESSFELDDSDPATSSEEDDEDNAATAASDEENKPSSPIRWLHGPADSGKSAVARLFAKI